jgi:hypothetical protein
MSPVTRNEPGSPLDQPGTTDPKPSHPVAKTPEDRRAEAKALRKNVGEAVKQAAGNLGNEIDAIRSQIAQGGEVSVEQIDALKASIEGIKATAEQLPASGGDADPKELK